MKLFRAIQRTKGLYVIAEFVFNSFQLLSQEIYELNSGWKCANISKVADKGTTISSPSYKLNGWLTATVPGTVLTTLLDNRLVPDPFFGMNNEMIPDIYTTGRDHYTYWFIKDFKEKKPTKNEQVWINFRGINYSCDIFLNGQKLNTAPHEGMFLRKSYNITSLLNSDGKNRLAVIVFPPNPVGNANGGQGGDGEIARNVTHQYVAGWDWIQPVRDRNTGIWDKVTIEKTGGINIKDPQIITLVPGKRIPGNNQAPAVLKVSAEMENPGKVPISGFLQYSLNGSLIKKQVTVPPGKNVVVTLPDHTIEDPKLWWAHGYGDQPLYKMPLQFVGNGKNVLDQEEIKFGVREIQTRWNDTTKSREIAVNGQKIFIKGGNWIISDAMLRHSDERYDAEVRFHRDMNLNLIRIWGGALTERPEFYAACDKYGMLVFQDFWFSGDCNGRWKDPKKKDDQETRRKYPDDHSLAIESLVDQIKMIRNHPSLALYCGGNEITPPQDILEAIKDSILPKYDHTRYFFDYSNSDSMSLNTLGGNGDGPYGIQELSTFWSYKTWPFNSEIGSIGVGDYESLKRFLPEENLKVFPTKEKVDSVWQYHKYIGYNNFINRYGEPKDSKDFAMKAQLVNYDQYRGLIEGFTSHMWNWYTGVIIWKTQNPWTALRGQMYDYYLDPNAGLYGLNKAGESLHIMFDPVRSMAMVSNHLFTAQENLHAEIKTIDANGKEMLIANTPVNINATSVMDVISLKDQLLRISPDSKTFLSMRLMDKNNKLISDNLYWLPDTTSNYPALEKMKKAGISAKAKLVKPGKVEVSIFNPGNNPLAFFNRVSLVDAGNKQRVLPVFYSDNYFSILPGESKNITIEYSPSKPAKEHRISLKGWNVDEVFLHIEN